VPSLFDAIPVLRERVPWVRLGQWPTPVEQVTIAGLGAELWVKREDLTSPRYGGNKVRTLEAIFGRAQAAGARRIWATGAYGSNHVVATVMHARAAGLDVGAILFPQPPSEPALANASAIIAAGPELVMVPSVVMLPAAMIAVGRRAGAYVMPPGGATTEGTLGAISAAFELAEQARAGALPWPHAIALPVGSGCTTAGLLAGLHLAHALGLAPAPPIVRAVRVTPWPITSRARLAHLAYRSLVELDRTRGATSGVTLRGLWRGLVVDGRYLGRGYGHMTAAGEAAAVTLDRAGLPHVDAVYAAKASAALLAEATAAGGPLLLWLTKSSSVLPAASDTALTAAPRALRHWLGRA